MAHVEKEQSNKIQQSSQLMASPSGKAMVPPSFGFANGPVQAKVIQKKDRDVETVNYATIADQIHTAITGVGTDETAVYSALAKLDQNPTAIAELKVVYKTKFKTDLVTDLAGDFSGDGLAHVQRLLATGQTAQSNRPAATLDMDKIAKKLYDAMNGVGTDETAIFDALATVKNNPTLMTQLKDAYKKKYGSELLTDLAGDLSGADLAYAQQLLADRSTSEFVNVHSEAEAKRAKEIIKAIKDDYGIEVNSQAGVDAIKKSYARVPKAILDQLKTTAWELRELEAMKSALDHYAPILGDKRKDSKRDGIGQEVTTVGKVDQAIDSNNAGGSLDTSTLGEYFKASTNFDVFTAGTEGVGGASIGGPFKDNTEMLETSITHEIAHGLLEYAGADFRTATGYWSAVSTKTGAGEAPMTPYGNTNANEDLSEAAKFFFVKPAELLAKCPLRHAFLTKAVADWKK
jgi:Annexin